MRRPIATVFNYSLDGLLADEGTEFWKFCDLVSSTASSNGIVELEYRRHR